MYSSILTPIDVSVPDICEQILAKALFHLNNSQCKLTLLAVAGSNADENTLDDIRSSLMAFSEQYIPEHQDRVQLLVKSGLPADQVLTVAETANIDCILIGAHRGTHSMLGRATLGSTAAKVASQAKCDVYIVKARGS
ncbi:MAG: universal stress protein [Reinekea sp.]|jgi:nucleotide-binding universal stress UspA family protein